MSPRQLWLGILVAVIVVVASNSIYVIRETERGVLLKFGEVVNPNLIPGLHFKVPFVNNVRVFDGRILTVDSSPERFFTQEKKAPHNHHNSLHCQIPGQGYGDFLHRDQR